MGRTASFLLFLSLFTAIAASALRDEKFKWPSAQVPLRFHSSMSPSDQNSVKAAMEEIQEKTCVRFPSVQVHDRDYLLVVNQRNSGCSSFLGKQGGPQQLILGLGCFNRYQILRQLMHALGFINEHTRPDRDEYVTIKWDNIMEPYKHNFNKKDRESLTLMDIPYAYDSIMHYPGHMFSKDGQSQTIVPKKNVRLSGGGNLSAIDAQRINKYYGCE